jgi:glycosyltransferase involved in cell wall biosynthesis
MAISSQSTASLLVISQVYVPDTTSVGQHMADAAEALADRGYRVVVMTSAAGYENPNIKYPRHEHRAGVEVIRFRLSSFGKASLFYRLLGQCLFLLQVIVRGLFVCRLKGILVSTSPPMAAFAALVISYLRGVPITYWLMDLNPDQVVELGRASRRNPLVLAMKCLNRVIFAHATDVVFLDQYMADRVERQYRVHGRTVILPPWPHNEVRTFDSFSGNPFRKRYNLDGRFVVMYSGNHSLASPVTTLVEAALALRDDPRFVFVFVGGGQEKRVVDDAIAAHRPPNIVSLPYQPLDQIKHSLSAADLHAVTLGNEMVGIIHPCKIYGAMAVGRPILFIGPRPSHASDIIDRYGIGEQVMHGDVSGLVAAIRRFAALRDEQRAQLCERARFAVERDYGKCKLRDAFCDIVARCILRSAPISSVKTKQACSVGACASDLSNSA